MINKIINYYVFIVNLTYNIKNLGSCLTIPVKRGGLSYNCKTNKN